MSHEVLISRWQSIFIFCKSTDLEASASQPASTGQHRPAPASTGLLRPLAPWICKKYKNSLFSGYQDLTGHLILTTRPWYPLHNPFTLASKFQICFYSNSSPASRFGSFTLSAWNVQKIAEKFHRGLYLCSHRFYDSKMKRKNCTFRLEEFFFKIVQANNTFRIESLLSLFMYI